MSGKGPGVAGGVLTPRATATGAQPTHRFNVPLRPTRILPFRSSNYKSCVHISSLSRPFLSRCPEVVPVLRQRAKKMQRFGGSTPHIHRHWTGARVQTDSHGNPVRRCATACSRSVGCHFQRGATTSRTPPPQ